MGETLLDKDGERWYMLNFSDGYYIDARNKQVYEIEPKHYAFRCLPFAYMDVQNVTEEDKTELLETYVRPLFMDDDAMEYFLNFFSCALFGHGFSLEKFLIMKGRGQAGKSFLCNLIKAAFGEYAAEVKVGNISKTLHFLPFIFFSDELNATPQLLPAVEFP